MRHADVIPLPKDFVQWVAAACAAGLSCPVGRALYVARCKRHTWPTIVVWKPVPANDPGSRWSKYKQIDGQNFVRAHKNPTPLELMERMRHSSAERWLAHWMNGGSVEGIKYTSDAQAIAKVRERQDSGLDEAQRLRRWIRRARRGTIAIDDNNDDNTRSTP